MATHVWILLGCLLLPIVYGQDGPSDDIVGECTCASITRQFARLTIEANEAERSIAILGQSASDLSNNIAEQRQQDSVLERTLVRLRHNSSIVDGKVKVVKQNYNIKQDEIVAFTRRIETAKNNLDNLEVSDNGRQEVIAGLRHGNEVHNEDLKGLRDSDENIKAGLNGLANSDNEVAATIQDQQSKRETTDGKLSEIRRQVRLNQEGIEKVKGNNKQREAEVAALQNSDRAQDDSIAKLQNANEAQLGVVNFLKENEKDLRDQTSRLSQKDTETSAAINSQQEADREIANGLSAREQTQVTISDSLRDLTQLDRQVQDTLSGYIHNDTIIQRRIDNLKDRDQSTVREVSRIDQRNKATEIDITTLRQNDVTLSERIDRLAQTYSVLLKEVALLKNQNAAYRVRAEALDRSLASIQAYFDYTHVRTVTKTTVSLEQIKCFRGMAHTEPRVPVLLWGNIQALCDTETDGGGWIVVQRRVAGDVNFNRGWADYRNGFGDTGKRDTDYWLGNENMYILSTQGYTQLRVDMTLDTVDKYATYDRAQVGNEFSNYRLSVGGYSGNAGNDLEYHDGMQFSTFDRDNDQSSDDCSGENGAGGFWYNNCYRANLNGRWGVSGQTGIIWKSLSETRPLDMVEIKVRVPYLLP